MIVVCLLNRGRLNHGRHFTFHSSVNDMAITLLSSNVTGSIADNEHRFAACGTWLQVCMKKIKCMLCIKGHSSPITFPLAGVDL